MSAPTTVGVVGASARAAAFSALRAGLRPVCLDLFADADLVAVAPVERFAPNAYPDGLIGWLKRGSPGPWLYAGGLENRPLLLRQSAAIRPLWGNHGAAVVRSRRPPLVARLLAEAGLPAPAVCLPPAAPPAGERWLVKPLSGAGGAGIRYWSGGGLPGRPSYFQRFIDGEACAAIYVGLPDGTRLLGVTRQLVGQDFLHAGPFRYCGSVGPLALIEAERRHFERIGEVLTVGCHLRGLFGVDAVRRDGVPWPVEVNPRYTASVEVLEHALNVPALAWHRQAFEPNASSPRPPLWGGEGDKTNRPVFTPHTPHPTLPTSYFGKAILFARHAFTFPADGPWSATLLRLHAGFDPAAVPTFADVPPAGELIEPGQPILTFFGGGTTIADCLADLRRIAADLDAYLGVA